MWVRVRFISPELLNMNFETINDHFQVENIDWAMCIFILYTDVEEQMHFDEYEIIWKESYFRICVEPLIL